MEKVKKIISFLALVFSFLFLPVENWPFWLQPDEEAMYAEFQITTGNHQVVIAKNMLEHSVQLDEREVHDHLSIRVDGGPTISLKDRQVQPEVLPQSYSVVGLVRESVDDPPMRNINGLHYFHPRALTMSVPAEQDKWAVLIFGLLVVTVCLSLAVYGLLEKSGGVI